MLLFKRKKNEEDEEKELITFEIRKKSKDEQFNVFDLTINHRECEKGEVQFINDPKNTLNFQCKRCNMQTSIVKNNVKDIEKILLKITRVALIGETFTFNDYDKKIVFHQNK